MEDNITVELFRHMVDRIKKLEQQNKELNERYRILQEQQMKKDNPQPRKAIFTFKKFW